MKKLVFLVMCVLFIVPCEAGIIVVDPNGGEELIAGQTEIVSWDTVGDINDVKIEFSDSNGQTWTDVNSSIPNSGSYNWTLPQVTSNQCLVRVSDVNDANVYGTSDNVFSVYVCQLNSPADMDKNCKVDFADFSVFAQDWLRSGNPFAPEFTEPLPMIWVSINDPGVSGHEAFNGQMSKYETTNAQYCQFLNAALASGDVVVDGSYVKGANGSNGGADFVGQVYYDLAGSGYTYDGATNGGAARINYSGSSFTVDSGFDNHPVTYVSWYGSTAFCNYYGYRLPTEWEWQAVADYNGSYTYGCGTTINNSIANCLNSTHPDGTTSVGAFGTYGYGMCDMSGNVWKWTSSCYFSDCSGGYRVFRGGGWFLSGGSCSVSLRSYGYEPYYTHYGIGFRVCR